MRRAGPIGALMLVALIGVIASAYLLVKHDRDARPTVPEVAYAAARGSTGAAPLPLKSERGLLALTHDGLAFPDWTSLGWVADGRRTDVIELLPASMKVADMRADNPGIWLYHCHVNDHVKAGMVGRYEIEK